MKTLLVNDDLKLSKELTLFLLCINMANNQSKIYVDMYLTRPRKLMEYDSCRTVENAARECG